MAEKNTANVSIVVRVKEFVGEAVDRIKARFRDTAASATADAAQVDRAVKDVAAGVTALERPAEAARDALAGVGATAPTLAGVERSAEEAAAALRDMDATTRRLIQETRALDAADTARVAEVKASIQAQRQLAREVGATALQQDRLKQVERGLDDRVARLARESEKALKAEAAAAAKLARELGDLGGAKKLTTLAGGGLLGQLREGLSSTLAWARGVPVLGAALTTLTAAMGAGQLSAWLLENNREFQRLQAQLRTFTGDADSAARKFDELQQGALTLPFELKNLTQAYIALRGAGIDPSNDMLEQFSNVATAAQKDIAELAEAIRGAATGEFERLKAFNVTARAIAGDASKLSVTFNGVTKTIGRDAASIAGYLYDLGKVEFAGAAARQMDTLDGKISTLQDNLFKLATAIGQGGATDAFTTITEEAIRFTNAIVENQGAIDYWTHLILEALRVVALALAAPFRAGWNMLTGLVALIDSLASAVAVGTGRYVLVALKALDVLTFGSSKAVRTAMANVEALTAEYTGRMRRRWQDAARDNQEAGDALNDVTRATVGLGRAVNATEQSYGALSDAQRRSLGDRDRMLGSIQTEIQLRRNLGQQERVLAQIIRDTQAQITALRAKGVQWGDRELKALGQQVNQAAALLVQAQQAGKKPQDAGDGKPHKDPLQERIDLLGKAALYDATRARALAGLATVEAHINGLLANRKLTLEQEVKLREKLQQVQEARQGDQAVRAEVSALKEAVALREEHAEAIAGLRTRETQLTAVVQAGEGAAAKRAAAERDLAQVRAELARVRERAAAGDAADDAAAVMRVTTLAAREQALVRDIEGYAEATRRAVAATGTLAEVRRRLSQVNAVVTADDVLRLVALEARLAGQLEAENRLLAAGNGHRERAIELARQLAAVRGVKADVGATVDEDAAARLSGPAGIVAPIARRNRDGSTTATTVATSGPIAPATAPVITEVMRPPRRAAPQGVGDMILHGGRDPNAVPGMPQEADLSFAHKLAAALDRVAERTGALDEKMRGVKGTIVDMGAAAFESLGDAAEAAFAQMGEGADAMGKAFLGSMTRAIAGVAKHEGMLALGHAAKALGQGILGTDPRGFAAAAKFATAAAIYFAVAGAAGAAGGGDGGGGGGGGGGGAGNYEKQRNDIGDKGAGEAVVEVYGSRFDLTDPRQQEEWRQMAEKLTDKKVTIRFYGDGTRR